MLSPNNNPSQASDNSSQANANTNNNIRPALQPPSSMSSFLASSTLSKALAKPPQLLRPSASPSHSSSTSPVPGNRTATVLTAPPPKSFLTLPKKLVTNPPHVTQTQQSLPAGEASQIPEARSNPDFNNSFRSNSSSVASELYNLTDISLGPNTLEPQQPQKQKSISPKPEIKNFFTSSLPNNASQLFAATSQQPQEEAFEALSSQQATNHSIDHLINKSNSTSTSSINQSLNSSLSSSQNNQIFNNNNNNQALPPSQDFFADKIAPVPIANIKNSLNSSDANISNYFQNEPLQQQPIQQASNSSDFNFSPANQNIVTPSSQQHQQTTHHIPQQQQPTYAQPIFQQQQTQQRNPIPNHPIPFQSYRPQSQAPSQPQFNNSIPSSTNPSPFSVAQPQQPINQQQSVNPSPMFFNPALGQTGTQGLLTGIQPPPIGSFQQQTPTGFQPPPTGSFQQPPPTGSFQQLPPTGSFQQPPPTGSFQQPPPTGSFQQPPPTGSFQQPPPTGSFQQQPPTGIQPPPTGSFQQPQFFNNNGNSIIKDNSLNLIKGPPTASEIGQRVQQSAQLNLNNQMKTGVPLLPPTNQFNNMSLNQGPSQPQQQYTRQPSSQQQQQQNYNLGPSKYANSRSTPQSLDLLREKRLINEYSDLEEPVRPQFPHEFYTNVNCHPDTIRCTLTAIPETQALLNKIRLPLGILIHPFKDLESLKVVQSSIIVRCRNCRSYINPFVHFIDNTKWRCNLCYSINDLPDEFLFDPVTRSYGDPSKRPEINSSTIEFIAPAEYTLRPPPPAMYLYLLDVSHNAITTGYLQSFCETMLENLDKIPGDSRTQIGFITYNSSLHFYNLCDSLSQPRMMIYPDLEDLTLPLPDNLMINLSENKESVQLFLQTLPSLFADTYETDSALGTALNAGFQLLKQTGGRLTIMQTCLPNIGVGSLKPREENVDKDPAGLAPQIDFYKKMALDCAGVHVAVDLFMFNSQYADLATLSSVSKYSGGEVKFYPEFHLENHPEQVIRFCVDFKRYLVRKIGFESVMRIRCTRGLTIHTFHGNFFVRSTDLLALPNVNPDSGFGMQIAIEEALTDTPTVCFQAAVLYTSSKGERRIRIHTYCIPVSKNVNELVNSADQECIIGIIAKMAVDRTTMSSLKEAKDALINVAIDYLQAYSQVVVSGNKHNSLLSPNSLRLIPLLVLALMKNIAFRFGSIKLDERVYSMNLMKTMPLKYLLLTIYPHLYAIHNLDDKKVIVDSSETEICLPPKLHLSAESIDRHGVYIMDAGEAIYMWIGRSVSDQFLQQVFDVRSFQELPDHANDLPELENILSERVRNFLVYLYDSRPFGPTFIYFREDSAKARLFFRHMYDDKTESSVSYYEFLKHLQDQVNH